MDPASKSDSFPLLPRPDLPWWLKVSWPHPFDVYVSALVVPLDSRPYSVPSLPWTPEPPVSPVRSLLSCLSCPATRCLPSSSTCQTGGLQHLRLSRRDGRDTDICSHQHLRRALSEIGHSHLAAEGACILAERHCRPLLHLQAPAARCVFCWSTAVFSASGCGLRW